jgi:ADP-heptose:LPS heptosyltransferase
MKKILINSFDFLAKYKEEVSLEIPDKEAILIVFTGFIGDCFLAMPAIRGFIKYNQASRKFYILGKDRNVSSFRIGLSDLKIETYFTYENIQFNNKRDSFKLDLLGKFKLGQKIKQENIGTVLDFSGVFDILLITKFARVKRYISINNQHLGFFATKSISNKCTSHWSNYYDLKFSEMSEMSKAGLDYPPTKLPSSGIIVMHPFASVSFKKATTSVINNTLKLLTEMGKKILLIGEPHDDMSPFITHKNISLKQNLSLEQLCELIQACQLFIGNDSAPLQIALYYKKTTISFWGGTNVNICGPLNTFDHLILKKDLPCSPISLTCYGMKFSSVCTDFDCLNFTSTYLDSHIKPFVLRHSKN